MSVRKFSVIVEDFALIAEAWKGVLTSIGFEKVLNFATADSAYEATEEEKPELYLLDINLKNGINGIELTKKICERDPEAKIIILTMHNESFFVKTAFEAGASGYVTKNSPMDELKHGIELVLKGEKYMCDEIRG